MVFKEKVIIGLSGTLFLLVFVFPTSVSSNIDCNGKAFHCVNSTHFKICVDLGGGVSSTVDDFIVPCPPPTLCKNTNHFECEFPTSTTAASNITSEVTNDNKTSVTQAWETISSTTISPQLSSEGEISALQMNTVSTTTPIVEKNTLIITNINETTTRLVLDDQVTPSPGIKESTYIVLDTNNSSTLKPIKDLINSTSLPLAVNESSLTSIQKDSYTTVTTTEALPTNSLSALIKNENTTISIGDAYLSTTSTPLVISKQAPNNTSSVGAITDGGLPSTTESVYLSTLQSTINNNSLSVTEDISLPSSTVNESFIIAKEGLTTPVTLEISTSSVLKDNLSETDRSSSSSVMATEISTSSYNENFKTTPIPDRVSQDSIDSKSSSATDGSKTPSSVITSESSTTIIDSSRLEFTHKNNTPVKDGSSLSTLITGESFTIVNNDSLSLTTQALENSSVKPVFNKNTSTIDNSSLSFTVVTESFISTNNENLTSTAAPFEISNIETALNTESTTSNILNVPSDKNLSSYTISNFTTLTSKLDNYESPSFVTENIQSPLNFNTDSNSNILLTTKSIESSTSKSVSNNRSASLFVKNDNSSYALTKTDSELTTTETIGSSSSNNSSDVTVSLAPTTDSSFASYYESSTVPLLFESISSNNVINNNDVLSFKNKSFNLDFNKNDENHTMTSVKENNSSKNIVEMDAVLNTEKSYSQSFKNDSTISVTEALPLELTVKENDKITQHNADKTTTDLYVLTTKPTTFDTNPPNQITSSTIRTNNNSADVSQQDVPTILPKVLESTSSNPFEYTTTNNIFDHITATLSPLVEIGVTVNQTQSSETKITTADYYTTSLPQTDAIYVNVNKEVQLKVGVTNSVLNNISSTSKPMAISTTDKTHSLPLESTGSVRTLEKKIVASSTNNPLENPNVETTTIMLNGSSYPVENSAFLDNVNVLSLNMKTEVASATLSYNETSSKNPSDKFTTYDVGTEEFITSTPTYLVISNRVPLDDKLSSPNISRDINVTIEDFTYDNTKNISVEGNISNSISDPLIMLTNTVGQIENNTVIRQNINNFPINPSINSNIGEYLVKLGSNASQRTDSHFGSNASNAQSYLPSANATKKEKSVTDTGKILNLLPNISKNIVDIKQNTSKNSVLLEQHVTDSPKGFENIPIGQNSSTISDTTASGLDASHSNTAENKLITSNVLAPTHNVSTLTTNTDNVISPVTTTAQNTNEQSFTAPGSYITIPESTTMVTGEDRQEYSLKVSENADRASKLYTDESSITTIKDNATKVAIAKPLIQVPSFKKLENTVTTKSDSSTLTTNTGKLIPRTLISPVTITAQNTNDQSSTAPGSYITVPESTTMVIGEDRLEYSLKVTENADTASKSYTDESSITTIKDNATKAATLKPVVQDPLFKKLENTVTTESDSSTLTTNIGKLIPRTLISPVTITAQNTNEQSSTLPGSYTTVPESATMVTGEYSLKVTENADGASKLYTDESSIIIIKDNATKAAIAKPVIQVPSFKKLESADTTKSDSLSASSNVVIETDQSKVSFSDITRTTIAPKRKDLESSIIDKLDNATLADTLTTSTEKTYVAIKQNNTFPKALTVAEGHHLSALQINDTSLKTITNQNTVNLSVDKIGNTDTITKQIDDAPIAVTRKVPIPLYNKTEYTNSSGTQYIDEIFSKKTNRSNDLNKNGEIYTVLGNVEQNVSNISLSNVPINQQNVNSSSFVTIDKYSTREKKSHDVIRNNSKDSVTIERINADFLPNVSVSNVVKSNSNTEDTLVAGYNQSNVGGSFGTQQNTTVKKGHVSNPLPIVSEDITNMGTTMVQNVGNTSEHITSNSLINMSVISNTLYGQHVKLVPSTSENVTSETAQIPIILKNNVALREQNGGISLSNITDVNTEKDIISQTGSFRSPLNSADRNFSSSYDKFKTISAITKNNSEVQNVTRTNNYTGANRNSDSIPNLSGKPIIQTFNVFSPESKNIITDVKQNISTHVFNGPLFNETTSAAKKNIAEGVTNNLNEQQSNTSDSNSVQYNNLFIKNNATLEKIEDNVNRSINAESGNRNVSSSQRNSDAPSTLSEDESYSFGSSSSTQENDLSVSNISRTVRNSKGSSTNKSVDTNTNIGESSRDVTSSIIPRSEHNNNHFNCHNRRRGRYGDNNDCRKFFICIGRNQPVMGQCPINTVFSEVKKQCIKNLSHCVRNNEFRCVTEGRFSDVYKENSYFICIKNGFDFVRFNFQCQNNYRLNKDTITCIHTEILKSSSSVNKNRSKKGRIQGFVDSNDRNSNTASEDDEDSKDSREVKRGQKDKDEKLKTNENDFECIEEGKFPDPEDRECRKYYVCERNKRLQYRRRRKRCDSDEAFDKDKLKCVDADTVECE